MIFGEFNEVIQQGVTSSISAARMARDLLHDGHEHRPPSATGTGWERTPWRATQRAAWEALDAS